MPATKKPRKKYRPRPILANPVGYVVEGMTLLEERAVSTLYETHEAMAALVKGQGTDYSWKIINGTLAVTSVLDEMYYSRDNAEAIELANASHSACKLRFIAKGSYGYTGSELQAMNHALLLHEEMLRKATHSEFELVFAETLRRINKDFYVQPA